MKLFVPEIGTTLTLTKDWKFTLYVEGRNEALTLAAGFNYYKAGRYYSSSSSEDPALAVSMGWMERNGTWEKEMILPSGSILTLDRIYIRKGVSEYSSLSFNLNRKSVNPDFSDFAKAIHTLKGRCRFWTKLNDANTIEFE